MDDFKRQRLSDRLGSDGQYETNLTQNQLIQVLDACSAHCKEMITYLLDKEDLTQRRRQLKLLRDCEGICDFTSSQAAKGSFLTPSLLRLCAYTCKHCSKECAQFSDPMSVKCSYICESCAKYCEHVLREEK